MPRPPMYSWDSGGIDLKYTSKFLLEITNYLGSGGCRKNWSDGSGKQLEYNLNSFIIGLINASIRLRGRQLEWEHEEYERKEKEHIYIEKVELLQQEKEKVRNLEKEAYSWVKSMHIRKYIQAVKESAIKPNGELSDELKQWVNWATQQADRFDPLKENPKSILGEQKEINKLSPSYYYRNF